MLGNDQIETLAERLLRGVTKQCSRGAVPPDHFARAVCIDDSICDLVEDSVSQVGPVFQGHALRSRSCRFARYSSAGERSALRRIWRVALHTRSGSVDRTRSLAAVSKNGNTSGWGWRLLAIPARNSEIGSLETIARIAKARHWRTFSALLRANSRSAALPGWGGSSHRKAARTHPKFYSHSF